MKGIWARERSDNDRARQGVVRGVDVGIESASANTPTIPRFSRSTTPLTLHYCNTFNPSGDMKSSLGYPQPNIDNRSAITAVARDPQADCRWKRLSLQSAALLQPLLIYPV
jgi:hypothetical protein